MQKYVTSCSFNDLTLIVDELGENFGQIMKD